MSEQTPKPGSPESASGKKRTAGAFDIRNVIGGLIGLYGIVLVLTGLIGGNKPAHPGSTGDDVGANLWVGAAMIVFGAAFLAWAYFKPTVVDEEVVEAARAEGHHDH